MDETIERTIMTLLEAAAGKSISPTDVARALAGNDEKIWSKQMYTVRMAAIRLACAGRVVIQRKGKTIDPNAIRGLYRIARPLNPEGPPISVQDR